MQYFGCDSYTKMVSRPAPIDAIEVQKSDCTELKKYTYNGFYAPSEEGKLFKKKGTYTLDSLRVAKQPVISMNEVKSIRKTYDAMGNPSMQVTFTEVGKQLFKEHTANNIRKKVAIIVKNELIMAPIINAEIPGGIVEISGNFTQEEVNEMYVYFQRTLSCVSVKK